MLTNNKYKKIYRTYKDCIEKDFYIPSFAESVILDRATGYFSLSSLALSIDGLIRFLRNNGHMRLLCSPDLSQMDAALIDLSTSLDKEHVTRNLMETVTHTKLSDEEAFQMDIICNMIAERKLEIKIAYQPLGIYHEKFGIFKDESGNSVYFNGSMNETRNALKYNHESIIVDCSWKDNHDESLCLSEQVNFENLWSGEDEVVVVFDFPEAVKHELFNIYKRSKTLQDAIDNYIYNKPSDSKSLYSYQEDAIEEFCENGYQHFYEMATGTGKTFTSIKTIEKLKKEIQQHLFVMICVPQIDLQSQWEESLKEAGYKNIYLFGGNGNSFDNDIAQVIIDYYNDDEDVICVAVYDTFFSKVHNKIKNINNIFLIVDEAHNLTTGQLNILSEIAPKYKLGLSATIQRFNASESNAIAEFFTQNKTFYYGIEDAIENDFLAHYEYHPIFVRLSDEEQNKFNQKSRLIALEMQKKEEERKMDYLSTLRRDRSLILKQTPSKIEKLQELIIGGYNFINSVVYCGQGKDNEGDSIINSVSRKLDAAQYRVSHFTSNTLDRKKVLYEFETGYFDTLVAIRCFDEGVDVPKLDKIYIMASDSSLRQTIQRRGRVLRKCKESGKTIAHIYDMVVLPAFSQGTSGCEGLLSIELSRVKEYNRLANNMAENDIKIKEIENEYQITIEERVDYESESN